MERKIRVSLIILAVLSLIVSVLLSGLIFHRSFQNRVLEDLRLDADILSRCYEKLSDYGQLSDFASGDLRLTLVSTDGGVLFESNFNAGQMENHGSRPEISDAVRNGSGSAIRSSSTFGNDAYYYAVRLLSLIHI